MQCGHGKPLLLVHGFPLDHQMWQGQIAELGDEFRVIAPDLRGFGHSSDATGTVTMQQISPMIWLNYLMCCRSISPWPCAACRWVATSPGSSGGGMPRDCRI